MTRWMIVMVVAACLIAAAGCLNVDVPQGPYIKVNDGSGASGRTNVEFTRDFLESAREDGVISQGQYEQLRRRLESSSGS